MKNSNSNPEKIYAAEKSRYDEFLKMNLSLDISRGKPSSEQLALSDGLLTALKSSNDCIGSSDYRNYGFLDGIPEAKKLFSEFMGIDVDEIMILGNSSLNIMYDTLQKAMQFGIMGNEPLNKQGEIKWLCPVPGYDRHFSVTEEFGIKMINVPMTENGPDMDIVENYVNNDPSVKGIWCVPKYSNPQGIVYDDETVRRFAKLKPAAPDFRIYWDNAYMVHAFKQDLPILNLLKEAEKYGNADIVYMFGSTSKITYAGGGIAFMAASVNNLNDFRKHLSVQTIGYDKINQLMHVKFFNNVENIYKHMRKHADLLRPKFQVVMDTLQEELSDMATWYNPVGGYFVSCDLPEGTAKRTLELAKNAGVIFTPAGSTFPYKYDPADSNVRIAPSFPPVDELKLAMQVFCCCAKIAYYEKNI